MIDALAVALGWWLLLGAGTMVVLWALFCRPAGMEDEALGTDEPRVKPD